MWEECIYKTKKIIKSFINDDLDSSDDDNYDDEFQAEGEEKEEEILRF